MADLEDIRLAVQRWSKRREMAEDIRAALRLLEHAQACGSCYGSGTHQQWKRIEVVRTELESIRSEVMKQVEAYRDEHK